MEIMLNGEPRQVTDNTTIAQLLAALGYHGKRIAVEVNLDIVPASQHDSHRLAAGDRVEIVHAIGGG